jgi:hypothetical protein
MDAYVVAQTRSFDRRLILGMKQSELLAVFLSAELRGCTEQPPSFE